MSDFPNIDSIRREGFYALRTRGSKSDDGDDDGKS